MTIARVGRRAWPIFSPMLGPETPMPLLEIENLSVEFPNAGGVLRAVDGVSLSLDGGEILGVVGESGSGKSVTMLALMGLVPYPGRVRADPLPSTAGIFLTSPTATAAGSPAMTWR